MNKVHWIQPEDSTIGRYQKKISDITGSDTFCILPWMHFATRPNGDMRLWHDYTHHYGHNLGFGLADEHRAFILALRELSAWWGSDDNMLEAMSAILYSEMVLQCSAAMWLGGYDQTRDGLTFTQKIVRI